MKLFWLSALFAASESSLAEMKLVKLDLPTRGELRRMVDSGDPGDPEQFGCIAKVWDGPPALLDGLLMAPETLGTYTHRTYRFAVGGFQVSILHPEVQLNADASRYLLNDDGTWLIRRMPIPDDIMEGIKMLDEQGKIT
jgi:hypothetical protein